MDTEEKTHIIWFSIVLTFITIVVLISFSTLSSIKEQTKLNIKESLRTVLHTSQAAQHLWISYRIREIQELTKDKIIVEYTQKLLANKNIKTVSPTLIKLRNFLEPKLIRNNDKGFFIISPDRISIASMRDTNLGSVNLIQHKRKVYLKHSFEGVSVFVPPFQSDISLSLATKILNTKEPTSFIVSPIVNNANEIIAVFAVRLDPSTQFSRISQLGRLGDSGETYAFDKEGMLITESRFDHQLRRAGKISVGEAGILSIRITDPGANLLRDHNPAMSADNLPLTLMAKSATTGNSGSNIDGYRDYRGVNVFGVWVWDKNLEIGMTTEIDVDEALQPYFQARFTIILAVTLIAILSFIFVLLAIWLQKKSRKKLSQAYSELEIRIDERTKDLKATTEDLNLANKELEKLAVTDGLTGLFNRRKFDQHIEAFLEISQREKKTISILMIDIDNFKLFNDNYGHQAGDKCLQNVAMAFEAADVTNRPGDIIARYGGEEFIIMLFDCTEQFTYTAAQKIHEKIHDLKILHEHNESTSTNIVTISLGICIESDTNKTNPSQIINKADEALYKAKKNGRNCTCSHKQIVGIK